MRRRLLILLLALFAAVGAPGLAHADNGAPSKSDLGLSPDANAAIAYNTQDGSALFQFAFALRHVMNGVVEQENAAVAYSKCTSCQTTAIAIEIVLVEGPTTTNSPQNAAIAVNESCTLCDTFASAYQFVIGTNGPVRFTHEGLRELHAIRKEIQSWGKQGLSNDEMRKRLPDLIARLQAVLKNDLVAVGRGEHEGDENQGDQSHGQANAPPTSTATTETGTVQDTTTVPTTDTTTDTTPTDTTATTPTTTSGTTTTTP